VRGAIRWQGRRNHFKYTVHIAKHVIIPESQHAISMLGEPPVAHRVALVDRVLAAVDFNDEPLLATNEIDDVGSDRFLTDELVTA
jgi:hypothetical protein